MAHPLPQPVAAALRSVRRRRRAQGLLRALCGAALGSALLLLLLPLAAHLPLAAAFGARIALSALVTGVLVGPVVRWFLPAWDQTASPTRLARALDQRLPYLDHGLEPAVELAAQLERGDLDPDGSAGRLALRHLDELAVLAGAVDARDLLPWSRLGRGAVVGPALLAAVLLVALVRPAPFAAGWQAILALPPIAPLSQTPEAPPVTLTLRNIVITLTPPAYSGRSELRLEGTTGDFQALAGTVVRLTADGESGTASAAVWGSGERAEGSAERGQIDVSFTVPAGAEGYHVEVDRSLGRESLRSRDFRVEIIPDRPPDLEVTGIGSSVDLAPDDELPYAVRAADDFGLSRLELVIEKGGRELARRPLADVAGTAHHDEAFRWVPRQDLGEDGGELQLIVEAWDNDTVVGPKLTRSKPVDIYVPTPRDLHRKVLDLKRQLLDHSVDLLGSLLVANHEIGLRERLALLAEHDGQQAQVRTILELGAELGAAMARDGYESRGAFEGVGMLLANLGRVWQPVVDAVEQRIRSLDQERVPSSAASEVLNAREPAVAEVERIVLDLLAFVAEQNAQPIADGLLKTEDRLARVAELLREAKDGALVDAQLKTALQKLKEELAQLARDMAQDPQDLPDGFSNQVPPELSQERSETIEQLIAEGRLDEAQTRIQEMMERARAMREELQKKQEQQAGSADAERLARQMDEAIEKARELEAQQKALLDDTKELEERLEDPATKQAVAEVQAQLEQAQAKIEQAHGGDAEGFMRHLGRAADQKAQEALDSLRAGDLSAAADSARIAAEYARELGEEAGRRGQGKQPQADAAQGAQLSEDAARRLDELEARSSQRRQASAEAGQPLASRQRSIAQSAGELQQGAEQMGSSAFQSVQGRDSLDAARRLMQKAEGRLGQGQTPQAVGAQQDALRQLQAFRESMEQSRQSMQGRQQRMGSQPGQGMAQAPGGSQPDPYGEAEDWGRFGEGGGKVKMADPDDFVTPDAFRELVQEGAGQDAPERYVPFNQRYYEELVR